MNKKILICGHRSFVASGLYEQFKQAGYQVECFSRGKEIRKGDIVTGEVKEIDKNLCFYPEYDVVINFILLKECSVAENVEYIDALLRFCKKKQVKHLIHISSIMAYSEELKNIDELTIAELDVHKRGYAALKNAIDKHLEESDVGGVRVSYVRPGFVVTKDNMTPYLVKLPIKFAVIKGNKRSILPIVKRDDIHKALLNMVLMESMEKVYLFLPSGNETKYQQAKLYYKGWVQGLPKFLVLGIAFCALKIHVLNLFQYGRIKGMFKETHYDSSRTEKLLQVKF